MQPLDTSIQRFSSKLKKLSTSTLWDRSCNHAIKIDNGLKNLTPRIKISGPAFIVNTPGEILPILQALDTVPEHHVLVINNTSDTKNALLGDIIMTAAKNQKVAGLVVYGFIRDVESLRELNFPVWAEGVNIVPTKLGNPIEQFPDELTINGAQMQNNDWVFGDENALISISTIRIRHVIKASEFKNKREENYLLKLNNGNRISDLMNLKNFLEGKEDLKVEF